MITIRARKYQYMSDDFLFFQSKTQGSTKFVVHVDKAYSFNVSADIASLATSYARTIGLTDTVGGTNGYSHDNPSLSITKTGDGSWDDYIYMTDTYRVKKAFWIIDTYKNMGFTHTKIISVPNSISFGAN